MIYACCKFTSLPQESKREKCRERESERERIKKDLAPFFCCNSYYISYNFLLYSSLPRSPFPYRFPLRQILTSINLTHTDQIMSQRRWVRKGSVRFGSLQTFNNQCPPHHPVNRGWGSRWRIRATDGKPGQRKGAEGRGQFSTLKPRPQLLCHVHKLSYRVLMLYWKIKH